MEEIDINFDFTQDTKGYWTNWWTVDKGDELLGTRNVPDPDSRSRSLNFFHKLLWSKQLPNGQFLDLQTQTYNGGYYFTFKNSDNTCMNISSDSLINSFRWNTTHMRKVLSEVRKYVETNLSENWRGWLESYVRKAYTIGGMIIFPSKTSKGINQSRGSRNLISDRVDLTFECIRRYYANKPSPLSDILYDGDVNSKFLNLFVDFKGYVDFFFLQDIVSDDYKSVKCFFGTNDFTRKALPQNKDEYMKWYKATLDFIEKRNQRIAAWVKSEGLSKHDIGRIKY